MAATSHSTTRKIRKALLVIFAERYTNIATGILVTAITARLLTPGDFGIVAIGMAVFFAITTVQDFGVSNYIVQQGALSKEAARSCCTITALLAIAMAGLVGIGARPLAAYLNLAGLAPFMTVLALTTLAGATGAPLVALMRRDLQFERLAILGLGSTIANAVVVVGCSALGAGHMSFAYSYFAANLTGSLFALALRRDWWIYKPSFVHWHGPLAFGVWSSLSDTLSRGQDLVLFLVLGRSWPSAVLGVFNRADFIATTPTKLLMAGIAPVALTGFATVARTGGSLKQAYFHALSLKSCVLWPAVLLLALFARPTVVIFLGNQWSASVPSLQILALAHLFAPPLGLSFAVLSAAGAVRQAALMGTLSMIAQLLLLLATVSGGPTGVAWALVASSAFSAMLAILAARRFIVFSSSEICKALAPSAITTALATCGPLAFVALGRFQDVTFVQAIGLAPLAIAGWMIGLRLTRHPLLVEIETIAADLLQKIEQISPAWRRL